MCLRARTVGLRGRRESAASLGSGTLRLRRKVCRWLDAVAGPEVHKRYVDSCHATRASLQVSGQVVQDIFLQGNR